MHLKNQLKATIYRMSFNIKLHSLMKFHGGLLETKCIIFPGAIKMATSQTAPCLSAKTGIPHLTLPIVAHSSEILVDLNEFYSFIKQHYKDSDKKGVPRRNNIRAEVMKYDHGIHSVYPSVCRTDGYGTDRRLQEHALFRAKNVFSFF